MDSGALGYRLTRRRRLAHSAIPSGGSVATVPESEAEYERDAQRVTKTLALLHKPVAGGSPVRCRFLVGSDVSPPRAVQIRQAFKLGDAGIEGV